MAAKKPTKKAPAGKNATRDLAPRKAGSVKAGRKAGEKPIEY